MKSTPTKQFAQSGAIGRPARRTHSTPTPPRRPGFTLIEIMVVLVIIAILARFLLPVIFRAQLIAREARVKAEISLLSNAVEEFKERYGIHPPSAIVLREDPNTNPYLLIGNSISARVDQRTVALFQRIWPNFPILTCRFDFDGDGTFDSINNNPVGTVDFNGNGVIDQFVIQLVGSECIAFFLGGMPQGYVIDNSGTERLLKDDWPASGFGDIIRRGYQGFSRNPVLPFSRQTDVYGANVPVPGRDDRFPPLFEFDLGRLVDSDPDRGDAPDGFWEYLDPLETNREEPYRYFSSYQGQAYNSISRLLNAGVSPFPNSVRVANPLDGTEEPGDDLTRDAVDPPLISFLPYYSAAPVGDDPIFGTGVIIPSQIQWYHPRSFQIISPGIDGRIGYGGRFNPDTGEGPWSGSDLRDADRDGDDFDPDFDRDNITSFTNGRLAEEE